MRRAAPLDIALVMYAALQATLYSSLLPLWEGFDEPFHYGYVQTLRTARTLPARSETRLSLEIAESLKLVPASHVVQRNLPFVRSYAEYFRLPAAERASLRARLDRLDPALSVQPSQVLNYEASQAPLAYTLLAAPDALWAHAGLRDRVWRLRVLASVLASVAIALIGFRLARQLGLPPAFGRALVFVLLSSQVLYATVAHVTNDTLAVPLAAALVSSAVDLRKRATPAAALIFAAALTAGLLTKSYFLAFIPISLGFFVWLAFRKRWRSVAALMLVLAAAPWYARNLRIYGSLSGMQEAGANAGAFQTITEWPWLTAIARTVRTALWVGNNTLNTFSASTTALVLGVLAFAAALYVTAKRRKLPESAEWMLLGACVCFTAALAWESAIVFQSYRGGAIAAAAWHLPPLAIPALALLFTGLAQSGWIGRIVAIAIAWLFAYVMSATYLAKLIPQYAGYPSDSVRLAALAHWYTKEFATARDTLSQVAVVSATPLLALTAVLVPLTLSLAAAVTTLLRPRVTEPRP